MKNRRFKYVASIGFTAIALAVAILFARERSSRPHRLLSRFIADPVPASLKILEFSYSAKLQGDWSAGYHVQISSNDFPRVISKLKQDKANPDPGAEVLRRARLRFGNILPPNDVLIHYELYSAHDRTAGMVSELLADSGHTNLFVMLTSY